MSYLSGRPNIWWTYIKYLSLRSGALLCSIILTFTQVVVVQERCVLFVGELINIWKFASLVYSHCDVIKRSIMRQLTQMYSRISTASCVICAAADEDERPLTHLLNDVTLYRVTLVSNEAVTLVASQS